MCARTFFFFFFFKGPATPENLPSSPPRPSPDPGKPKPLSEASDRKFPPALEGAVMKGLARQPGDRQPTVMAFAEDLEAALAGAKDGPKSRGPPGALKKIVGKRTRE